MWLHSLMVYVSNRSQVTVQFVILPQMHRFKVLALFWKNVLLPEAGNRTAVPVFLSQWGNLSLNPGKSSTKHQLFRIDFSSFSYPNLGTKPI